MQQSQRRSGRKENLSMMTTGKRDNYKEQEMNAKTLPVRVHENISQEV